MNEELPMKAVEFESTVSPEGQITLPADVVGEIPAGEQLRVVVMWQPSEPDAAWRSAGRQRFEDAYCPEDAVYEQLIDDTPARSSRLDSKPQIWKLASDLRLPSGNSPTGSILRFVKRRVRQIAKKFSCQGLQSLLAATAAEVDTVFEEVNSDGDLQQIRAKYVKRGEVGFANLEADLRGSDDYAITIRRINREEWEPLFVSVIDCRGGKAFRAYFSKWHELAH